MTTVNNSDKEQPPQPDMNKWADFYYHQLGVNILPAITQKKLVTEKWSQWQINPIPEELFNEWKAQDRFKDGIAVIVGKVWRGTRKDKYLIFIDCDNRKAIEEFCTKDGKSSTLQEAAELFLVEQHSDNPDKAHIFFFSEEPFPKKSSDVIEKALSKDKEQVDIPLFEVKGRGGHGIAFVTPSMHKGGYRYEIIGTSDPIILHRENAMKMQFHLNSICKKYGLHYLENVDTSTRNSSKVPIDMLYEDDFQIYEGQNRHEGLMRFIESLLHQSERLGMNKPKIIRKLAEGFNQTQCNPPLDKKEFEKQWKAAHEFIAKKRAEENSKSGVDLLTEDEVKILQEREELHSKLIKEFKEKPDNLYENLKVIPLAQLGMDFGDNPVVVTGNVVGLSTLLPDWSMVKFRCKACDQLNKSDIHDETKPPKQCRMCESEQGFKAEIDWSIEPKLNMQTILLQDGSESLPCILAGVQSEMWPVKPGQKIQALGIQRYETYYNARAHRQDWNKYFKLLAIKPIHGLDISYTEQDIKYFKDLTQIPNFIEDILLPSFAAHITGEMNNLKMVCIYTLASQGMERPLNSILLGPPARGKTELVEYAKNISHHGNLTTFINASVAGLTSETVKDPITGASMAKPGILATFSLACFTDLNGAIHHSEGKKLLLGLNDALERKVATSGKAGGAQEFEARCAVLMDSNNHAATWYYDDSLTANLNFLPKSFMSRIDLSALTPEKVSEEQHTKIGKANYKSYRQKQNAVKLHEGDWIDPDTGAPRLGFNTLRKFFFYVSHHPLPEMPDDKELEEYFAENYVQVMKSDREFLIDGRYNRTVMMLGRVRARILLKDTGSKSDLQYAIQFVNGCKNIETLIPSTGEHDANPLLGLPSKQDIEDEEMIRYNQWMAGCKTAMEQSEYMDENGTKFFTKHQLSDILTTMLNTKWLERDKIWKRVDDFEHAKKMRSIEGELGKRLYTWILEAGEDKK